MITNVDLSFSPYHFEENDDAHRTLIYPECRHGGFWDFQRVSFCLEFSVQIAEVSFPAHDLTWQGSAIKSIMCFLQTNREHDHALNHILRR